MNIIGYYSDRQKHVQIDRQKSSEVAGEERRFPAGIHWSNGEMNIETSVHSSSNYNEYFFKLSDAPKESFWLFFSIWKLGPYDGRRGGGKEAGREGAQEEGKGVLLINIEERQCISSWSQLVLRAGFTAMVCLKLIFLRSPASHWGNFWESNFYVPPAWSLANPFSRYSTFHRETLELHWRTSQRVRCDFWLGQGHDYCRCLERISSVKRFGLCSIVAVESSQHRFAIRWEHGLQQNSRGLNNILLDSINISEKRYKQTQVRRRTFST